MNAPQSAEFQEAVLLADYAIKTALVQVGVLDRLAIQTLRANSDYASDVMPMLHAMEAATESLEQAQLTAKHLMTVTVERVQ